MSEQKARCGLCDKWLDCTWEEHVNSDEHKQKLANLGGMDAIMDRHRMSDKIAISAGDVRIGRKLAEQVDSKMESLITGEKRYNIYKSDDFERLGGFINSDGEWFSCDATDHEPFALDYFEMFATFLEKKNKKLYNALELHKGKFSTYKDWLVDEMKWVSISDGLYDIYIQPCEDGLNHAQKKTLKKWFLKFKKPFRIEGDIVTDEYHDYFQEVR